MGKFKASLFACLVSIGASVPAVASTHYTINLDSAPAGGFDYGSGAFSNLLFNWNGFSFDMTAEGNAGPAVSGAPGTCSPTSGAPLAFLLLSQDSCLSGGAFSYQGHEQQSAGKVSFAFHWNGAAGSIDLADKFDHDFQCTNSNGARHTNAPLADCQNTLLRGAWNLVEEGGSVAQAVPEPATLVLLGLGLAGLGLTRRRKNLHTAGSAGVA